MTNESSLHPDRLFEPANLTVARDLYRSVKDLPIVSPHGHVDPAIFSDPDASFGTPTELLIIPDHYVFRMLYSQGFPLENLGLPTRDGTPVETDHRKIWQIFADNFYLFRGTPSGIWLQQEMVEVFGITEKLTSQTAQGIYDQIEECLQKPEYKPRALYDRFNIETLCTTDPVTKDLDHHLAVKASDWNGKIVPTYRADSVFNLMGENWLEEIRALSEVSGIDVVDYRSYIQAIEQRRSYFKAAGATATDMGVTSAFTHVSNEAQLNSIFQRALQGAVTPKETKFFTAHLIMENARMSSEDGLVMQLHVGSNRNHNDYIFNRFGSDKGMDIPEQSEFTKNLQPLLNQFGNHPNLNLIIFTLDESTYARELAPLAGVYQTIKLGPPWWFYDSVNGIERYFDLVMETAGIYNTVGFNDDTRAFPSIPARHDLWRRLTVNWLSGLVVRQIIDEEDAYSMAKSMCYDLAKQAYRLEN